MTRYWPRSRAVWLLLAGIAIVIVFIAANHRAYDGFFQDDELDNLKWAPSRPVQEFLAGFLTPKFALDNFRPTGHLYFALMGSAFGLDFPPYITPIFALHLLNGLLLFLLMRKLAISPWSAMAAAAFFILSASALDAYWKPMYIFDLLCATLSLASVLLYAYRLWVLSFVAFWLAYKAKELAVMLPAVLAAWEYWFGERKFRVLIPFFLVSLSFGIQGIVLNPNKNNAYSFVFTPGALRHTIPFYAKRFLLFPLSGLALFALTFIGDRRAWFGIAAMSLLMVPLIFLPGRLFEAYAYLPLAFATIALAAAASHGNPACAWIALAVWMPFNLRAIRHEGGAILDADEKTFAFVESIGAWAAKNPGIDTFVYDGRPPDFHDWGITGAWNIAHKQLNLPALFVNWPETRSTLSKKTVAYGSWNPIKSQLTIRLHPPDN